MNLSHLIGREVTCIEKPPSLEDCYLTVDKDYQVTGIIMDLLTISDDIGSVWSLHKSYFNYKHSLRKITINKLLK